MEIEPLLERELVFEGPGHPKCFFLLAWSLPKICEVQKAHATEGGGWGNLSGLEGPSFVSKLLIGTGTPLRPKRTTPRRCPGTILGTVGKDA